MSFQERIDRELRYSFFQFIIYYQIPWILSWNFCFHYVNVMGSYISTLAHKIYIRWWDRFSSPISLYGLPQLFMKKEKAIFSESVSISSKCKTPKIYSTFDSNSSQPPKSVSVVYPLALPLNVYLQYLQVKHNNPQMAENDIIQLAYTLDFCSGTQVPITPKHEVPESPIQMTQQDINEVLTALNTPSIPLLGGYGQPELTSQDFICSKYNQSGHMAEFCTISPIISKKCYYCGESGHSVKHCSYRGYSPSTIDTPNKDAKSAKSETSPVVVPTTSTTKMTSSMH